MLTRRTLLKGTVAAATCSAIPGRLTTLAASADPQEPLISNLREVTISVQDFDESLRFYREQFGYETAHSAELSDENWRKLWRVPPGTSAKVAILRSAGSDIGAFRLVQFFPTSKVFIRVPFRPLDTSFVGCDMPTRDVSGSFTKMTGSGWGAVSSLFSFVPPQMTHPVTVAVIIGPSGERLPLVSLTELQNHPAYVQTFKAHAPIYIAFQVSEDLARDTALYTALGLSVVRDRQFLVPALNRTVGLPEDTRWRSLQVSHPNETFGRVGLVQYFNHHGRNVSDRSDPPNLGVLMLSFRTRDMAETRARLRKSAAQIMCEPIVVDNALYSERQALTAKQPNGGWIEFYT